jgi:GR25 family glycosyltransferase involved in LPS biosynthesis
MNLCDLTKNIYVINLKRRRDRLEHIEDQLEKIGCSNYQLIEAVDGSKLKESSRIKKGALGLVKTYLNIYESWKDNNDGFILLIEDDCIFLENFNENLETYLINVPEDWDCLYFGGNHNYHVGGTVERINEFCIKLNNTYTTHCLLMKSQIFINLISDLKNLEVEVDVGLAKLQKHFNFYSTTEKITSQINGFSNIEETHVNYDWLIK